MTEAIGSKIIDETSVTADVYSSSIFPKRGRGFSMTYDWNNSSGDLVAAMYLQCRNHRDEAFRDCNNASFPSSPDGSIGKDEYAVTDCLHAEYRVFVDFTSGDGDLNMRLKHGE